MSFVEALKLAESVMEQYRLDQPKWWKRMDGTPILNDVSVRMAEAFLKETERLRAEVERLMRILGDPGTTHAEGCSTWGPKHWQCALNERDALLARVEAAERDAELLRQLCACAYQMAGAAGAPVRFLDALSRHDGITQEQIDALLPVFPYEFDAAMEGGK